MGLHQQGRWISPRFRAVAWTAVAACAVALVIASSARAGQGEDVNGSDSDASEGPTRIALDAAVKSRFVWRGGTVVVTGRLQPASAGERVVIESGAGGRWRREAIASVRRSGIFRASWQPSSVGLRRLRVRARFKRLDTVSEDSTGAVSDSPRAEVTRTRVRRLGSVAVLVPGGASYFGPGLFGSGLACGGRLTTSTRGVAHRSLPCGTRVHLYYRGRVVTTRVVDRGPFVGGRVWDLTYATKMDLGFGSTGVIGAAW